ncbi:MAG: FAD-dependent oxidoreductase [Acholeplasmatales bacterium]|nr:FAD-dependent oxidoreductase [Acholeplasmatales bacterium]
MDKKKIIIIGAGISGMTAGIYALLNDFDVEIYEKHTIPGGQCTGWYRDNCYIDGCLHWVVGTNPKGQLFPIWKTIGAFDENTKIYETEYFNKYDIDGEIVTFYSDLNKLKAELLRIGPDDKKIINKFIKGIKAYRHVRIPVEKPMDMMNIFDYMKMGIKMLPMLPAYLKYTHITVGEFAEKCKSKLLEKTFKKALYEEFNLHSLLYIMQALSLYDAGVAEGGSLKFAQRVANKFKSLGGKLYCNTPVEKIATENNLATGIILNSGEFKAADYVVSATDVHYTLYNLLENKFEDEFYNKRFDNREDNSLTLCVLASYKVTKDISSYPKMIEFDVKPFNIGKTVIKELNPRNYSFDKTLNKDCTTLGVLIRVGDDLYDMLKNMNKVEYQAYKNSIGNTILEEIKRYYNLTDDDIKFLDLTTPITYERYCNAYRGSYQSFVTSSNHEKLMDTGLVKGLDNFIIAGQWVMPPGGLPIALFTGRHEAYRITRMEHKKFKTK